MLPFVGELDGTKIHVQAPTSVVFLCGGQCSAIGEKEPLSLRDAFLKIIGNPIIERLDIILAEDITGRVAFAEHYKDLLLFETDLAQIAEIILLFSESEGSFAELGAFSMVPEIADRLLVVIRDKYWATNSFITLGPLRALENRSTAAPAVFVVDDVDIGMVGKSAAHVRIDVLSRRLEAPLKERLDKARVPTTFDAARVGHVIKLIVGLVQEYGALTLQEISQTLDQLGVSTPAEKISAYMHCAEAVKWIIKKRKGSLDYFFARQVPDAATLGWKANVEKNKVRRRLLIREHWKQNEELRHLGIVEAFGGAAS